jgi:hypothetical protein
LALADRDRREALRDQQSLTAAFFGDPLPGMSALDQQRRKERLIEPDAGDRSKIFAICCRGPNEQRGR